MRLLSFDECQWRSQVEKIAQTEKLFKIARVFLLKNSSGYATDGLVEVKQNRVDFPKV